MPLFRKIGLILFLIFFSASTPNLALADSTFKLTREMMSDFSIHSVHLGDSRTSLLRTFHREGKAGRYVSKETVLGCAFHLDGTLYSLRSNCLDFKGTTIVQNGDAAVDVKDKFGEPDEILENGALRALVYDGKSYKVFFEIDDGLVTECALMSVQDF